MNKWSRVFLSVFVLVLVWSPVSAGPRLSSDQITARISGNTITIVIPSLQEARGFFSPDGSLRGRDGDKDFVGTWKVKDDTLCVDVPKFQNTLCRNLFADGDQILFFTHTGDPAGRVEVTNGNPDGY